MKASVRNCFWIIVVVVAICWSDGASAFNPSPFCVLVKEGVKFGSFKNCQTYYECRGSSALEKTCASDQSYDKDSQACRPQSEFPCSYGVGVNPCASIQNTGFVPVGGSCSRYTYCENQKAIAESECPGGMIFVEGACVYGVCEQNISPGGNNTEILSNICHIMPDKTMFGSTMNCNSYQYCSGTTLVEGECPTGMVFDVQTTKCVTEKENTCARVNGKDIVPSTGPKITCDQSQVDAVLSDTSNCNIYYKCNGVKWTRYQCPTDHFYSEKTQKCAARQEAKPNKSCNRCMFSKKAFVNSVDTECRGYLHCQNSTMKSVGECSTDRYFSELFQGCVPRTSGLVDYVKVNGACFT